MHAFARLAGPVLGLASLASAALDIYIPDANHWWVSGSDQTFAWTGNDPATFNVWIANINNTLKGDWLLAKENVQAFSYSGLLNGTDSLNLTAAQGYQVILTDPANVDTIYAASQPFEVKEHGALYPENVPTTSSSVSASQTASAPSTTVDPQATGSTSAADSSASDATESAGATGNSDGDDNAAAPIDVQGRFVAAAAAAALFGAGILV